MSNRKGDPEKQPAGCKGTTECPNLKEVSAINDFDGETYDCEICGRHFRLYYEDMT